MFKVILKFGRILLKTGREKVYFFSLYSGLLATEGGPHTTQFSSFPTPPGCRAVPFNSDTVCLSERQVPQVKGAALQTGAHSDASHKPRVVTCASGDWLYTGVPVTLDLGRLGDSATEPTSWGPSFLQDTVRGQPGGRDAEQGRVCGRDAMPGSGAPLPAPPTGTGLETLQPLQPLCLGFPWGPRCAGTVHETTGPW